MDSNTTRTRATSRRGSLHHHHHNTIWVSIEKERKEWGKNQSNKKQREKRKKRNKECRTADMHQ